MTFGSSNWPMILASVKKSNRFLSDAPAFSVLMATVSGSSSGSRCNLPLQTSPNSPATEHRNHQSDKYRHMHDATHIFTTKQPPLRQTWQRLSQRRRGGMGFETLQTTHWISPSELTKITRSRTNFSRMLAWLWAFFTCLKYGNRFARFWSTDSWKLYRILCFSA